MKRRLGAQSAAWWAALAAGMIAGGYAAVAGRNWYRYGRIAHGDDEDGDSLLDTFMPDYDVVERHHVNVAAPAAVTMAAAKEQNLLQIPLVRAIFKTRELVLGAAPDEAAHPRGLLAEYGRSDGGVLAEDPGREVVVGAYTQPWEPDVVFHALPPDEFKAFNEPGFVKIAWTLRADPISDHESIFRTETRAIATDRSARSRFRRYWAVFSPGIALIRRLSLGPLRSEAERLAKSGA